MNGAISSIGKNLNYLDNSHNYYILVPHKIIAKNMLKLYCYLSLVYLFSFNTVMTALLTPVYVLMLYTFYYYYRVLKSHGYKLFTFLIVSAVCNMPFLALTYYLKALLGTLLKEGNFEWISKIFQ